MPSCTCMLVCLSVHASVSLWAGIVTYSLTLSQPVIYLQGLLKARKILEEDFGNIHIVFGDPMSIREFSDGKVNRSKHSLAPRWVSGKGDGFWQHLHSLLRPSICVVLDECIGTSWAWCHLFCVFKSLCESDARRVASLKPFLYVAL